MEYDFYDDYKKYLIYFDISFMKNEIWNGRNTISGVLFPYSHMYSYVPDSNNNIGSVSNVYIGGVCILPLLRPPFVDKSVFNSSFGDPIIDISSFQIYRTITHDGKHDLVRFIDIDELKKFLSIYENNNSLFIIHWHHNCWPDSECQIFQFSFMRVILSILLLDYNFFIKYSSIVKNVILNANNMPDIAEKVYRLINDYIPFEFMIENGLIPYIAHSGLEQTIYTKIFMEYISLDTIVNNNYSVPSRIFEEKLILAVNTHMLIDDICDFYKNMIAKNKHSVSSSFNTEIEWLLLFTLKNPYIMSIFDDIVLCDIIETYHKKYNIKTLDRWIATSDMDMIEKNLKNKPSTALYLSLCDFGDDGFGRHRPPRKLDLDKIFKEQ